MYKVVFGIDPLESVQRIELYSVSTIVDETEDVLGKDHVRNMGKVELRFEAEKSFKGLKFETNFHWPIRCQYWNQLS